MKKQNIITIIGNIGAGKTSATPIIAQALDAYAVDADNLFQTSDPFRDGYLKDRNRWVFTNELWLVFERAKILQRELTQTKHKVVVIDSGLLMSWVYGYSHWLKQTMTQEEWNFFIELYDFFTSQLIDNMTVISLHYPIETLLDRIKQRGREFELTYYDQSYLNQIEEGIEALEIRLKSQGVRVIRVDETLVKDFVHEERGKKKLMEVVREEL